MQRHKRVKDTLKNTRGSARCVAGRQDGVTCRRARPPFLRDRKYDATRVLARRSRVRRDARSVRPSAGRQHGHMCSRRARRRCARRGRHPFAACRCARGTHRRLAAGRCARRPFVGCRCARSTRRPTRLRWHNPHRRAVDDRVLRIQDHLLIAVQAGRNRHTCAEVRSERHRNQLHLMLRVDGRDPHAIRAGTAVRCLAAVCRERPARCRAA